MTALIIAAISVAALVWLIAENVGLVQQNQKLRDERDLARSVTDAWGPLTLVDDEPIYDAVVIDFCRDPGLGGAS